jgi:N-ethylmaleimide reductase
VEETLLYLCEALNRREIAYLHAVYQLMPAGNMEDSAFDETHLSDDLVRKIRAAFQGTLIWCGGFTKTKAQAALDTGWTDLIAFGRPFVANPDLVARLRNDWPIVEADPSAFYTRNGEKGYTDFPNYNSGDIVPREARSPASTAPAITTS